MVTKIEGLPGQPEVLLGYGEKKSIPSEKLNLLQRPGRYEVTSTVVSSTVIQEFATEKSETGLPIALKPQVLMNEETVFLRVLEKGTENTVKVTNYPDPYPQVS